MLAVLVLLMTQAGTAPIQASVDQAWTVLKDGIDSKSSDRRAKAVHALGLLTGNAKAEEWAEKALEDTSPDVRAEAADALGEMAWGGAKPKLRAALNDADIKVVIAAANALYTLKDPAAYEVYYALLTGERKSSASLLQSQLNTLKNRKDMEKLAFETGIGFVPFGGMGYEAWKRVTQDDTSPVRAAAAEKLANDPDAKTGEALGNACSDKHWQVRAASANAIARRGDPRLLPDVVSLLYDDNDTVRSEAAGAVIRLSTRPRAHRKRERK